jgi:hypothetical protein
MLTVPLENKSTVAIVLVIHSCVPSIEQITMTDPRLVTKLVKNINVFCVVGIFSGK